MPILHLCWGMPTPALPLRAVVISSHSGVGGGGGAHSDTARGIVRPNQVFTTVPYRNGSSITFARVVSWRGPADRGFGSPSAR